jgi:hypothetical protein
MIRNFRNFTMCNNIYLFLEKSKKLNMNNLQQSLILFQICIIEIFQNSEWFIGIC